MFILVNLLSETKINYWFKHLLNCNISAILVFIIKLINISKEKQISYYLIRYIKQNVHLYTPPTTLTNKNNDHKKESDRILIYSPLFIVYLYLIVLSP